MVLPIDQYRSFPEPNIPMFQCSNRTTCLSKASRSNERPFGPELKAAGLKAEGLSTGCERSELSSTLRWVVLATTARRIVDF